MFLYGSNLQWRMNQLSEQMRTPLAWMAGEARRRRRRSRGDFDRWASALSRSTAPATVREIGLLSVPAVGSRDRTLVSYRRLADAPLRLDVITRSGIHALEGAATFVDSVPTAGTLLHFYRFDTTEQRRTSWRHRP